MSLRPALLTAVLTLAGCAVEPGPLPDGDGKGDVKDDAGRLEGTLLPLPAILNVGHRGAPWSGSVENTLESFRDAVRQGATMIETDFCMTKDGVAVIWHDCDPDDTVSLARQAGLEGLPFMPWVPNLGNGFRRPVEELTLAELREHYDYQVAKGFVSSTFGNGERVGAHLPTLEEFVAWSKTPEGSGMQALYVDVKLGDGQVELAEAMAAELLQLTADTRFHIFVGSPHESVVTAMRAYITARPHAGFHFMWDHERAGALQASARGGFDAISMGKTIFRSWTNFAQEVGDVLAGASAAGVGHVLVWTFDDDQQIMALLDAGVDGILTNRPADLARLVARGWDDHDAALAVIQACATANEHSTQAVTCPNTLALAAPLREAQVAARACESDNETARDLFGCALVFDRVEVTFRGELTNSSRLVWDPRSKTVVIGP